MSGTRLFAMVIGFWLLMRSVNKDSSGRTLVDRLVGNQASQSPLLATPLPAGGSSNATPGAGGLLQSLFPTGTKIAIKRQDQGRDLQVPANTPVLAPGNGFLVHNSSNPTGFGDSYPVVHFTTGPWAGLDVYIGHVKSLLTGGSTFQTGQPIARTQAGKGPFVGNAAGLPGWLELGRAPGGSPGPNLQPLLPGLGQPSFTG